MGGPSPSVGSVCKWPLLDWPLWPLFDSHRLWEQHLMSIHSYQYLSQNTSLEIYSPFPMSLSTTWCSFGTIKHLLSIKERVNIGRVSQDRTSSVTERKAFTSWDSGFYPWRPNFFGIIYLSLTRWHKYFFKKCYLYNCF